MKNILVLDSGVGAISIANEIRKLIKANLFICIDNLHAPLGEKEEKELKQIALNIVRESLEKFKIDLVVVACNTLTVASIKYLRECFNVPFVGTEPNIKVKEKNAIILCTTYTANNCQIIKTSALNKIALPKLATLIDKNLRNLQVLSGYLSPFLLNFKIQKIEAISFGCTHYTYIESIIKKYLPEVKIYQNKEGVAKRVKSLLKDLSENDLVNRKKEKDKKTYNLKRVRKKIKANGGKVKLILSKKDKKFKKQLKRFMKIKD